jgi:hypothetical protein
VLNLLGARYVVLPGDFSYPGMQRLIPKAGEAVQQDRTLWFNPSAFPRAWIVRNVVTLPPLRDNDPRSVGRRARRILSEDGAIRDFRETAVVETDTQIDLPEAGERDIVGAGGLAESCRMVVVTARRMEIDVQLARPGFLVVSDTFYPGWSAEIKSGNQPARTADILRTNRVMRGVAVPAGKHRVVFQYRPTLFYIGALISIGSWAAWLTFAIWTLRRRRTPSTAPRR